MGEVPDISDAQMEAIDRYLSGTLGPAERKAFEAMLAASPALDREVRTQRRLEESLRRVVIVPSEAAADAMLARAIESRAAVAGVIGARGRLALAIAAALAIMAGVMIFSGGGLLGGPKGGGEALAWDRALAAGFVPEVAIADRVELQELIGAKLGSALTLPERAGLSYTGVRTDVGGSPLAVGVIAMVDGRPVLLVVDRGPRSDDPALMRDDGPVRATALAKGVHRFDRRIGGLDVTEWSDQPEPRLVGLVKTAPGGR